MQQASYRILRQFPPPEIERAWRRFLEAIDLPSHYVTPEYFLEPSIQSARPFVLVAESAGAITGILTGRYLGRNLISGMPHRPQLVLAKGDGRLPAEKALIQGLLQEGRSCRLITVYAWEPLEGFSAAGFETTETAGTFLLYLSGSAENLFQGISARKRTYIHQVKRKGVDIKDSYDIQDIDELLDVFNETHRRHRLPLRTRTELEALLKLDCNRKLFIARAEGRVIAATIIRFVRGGLAEYSENVSLERMRHYHPTRRFCGRQYSGVTPKAVARSASAAPTSSNPALAVISLLSIDYDATRASSILSIAAIDYCASPAPSPSLFLCVAKSSSQRMVEL